MLDTFELRARRQAVNDFHRARTQAALQQMASRLTGKSVDLLSYQAVARQLKVTGRAAQGLQSIPLAAIIGSVGRYQDFSRTFLPRRASDEDRWVSVRTAGQMKELFGAVIGAQCPTWGSNRGTVCPHSTQIIAHNEDVLNSTHKSCKENPGTWQ